MGNLVARTECFIFAPLLKLPVLKIDDTRTAQKYRIWQNCRITLKIEDTLGLEVEFHTQWTPEARQRLERIPSFARGMVVKGIERFAEERNITLISEEVVKKSREEMIEKRGAMFPFLKKFINSEK